MKSFITGFMATMTIFIVTMVIFNTMQLARIESKIDSLSSSPSFEASPSALGTGLIENYRGVEQCVARQAHNLEVAGSNPAPAIGSKRQITETVQFRLWEWAELTKVGKQQSRPNFIGSDTGAGLHFFPPHKRSRFTETCPYFGQQELSVIRKAAERNSCYGDDFLILLAIRKAENGRSKLAFGIMDERANTFDKQAGWCAATIVKNRGRWEKAGRPEDFIRWFSIHYCPLDYINWERNMKFWVNKLARTYEKI